MTGERRASCMDGPCLLACSPRSRHSGLQMASLSKNHDPGALPTASQAVHCTKAGGGRGRGGKNSQTAVRIGSPEVRNVLTHPTPKPALSEPGLASWTWPCTSSPRTPLVQGSFITPSLASFAPKLNSGFVQLLSHGTPSLWLAQGPLNRLLTQFP